MRKIWVKIDPWDKELVTTALEGGAHGLMLPKGYSEEVKKLGKVQTIAEDGDLVFDKDVVVFNITSSADEEKIVKLCQTRLVILQCEDWTIIPLENLIAKGADVVAMVRNAAEARTAFGILEQGVRQILVHSHDAIELKKILNDFNSQATHTELVEAEIVDVSPLGMGDRVCVDTCTAMDMGQGMLVGNSSSALFLIHAESVINPYAAPRPFRVNAGPVHAYTRVPGGKTRYLSELNAGDAVQLVDFEGNTSDGVVGRVKIEKRPLMLVRAQADHRTITAIVQNAETIRMTNKAGQAVSVVTLKPGDRVLVALEAAGRHFGHKIDETIMEQ